MRLHTQGPWRWSKDKRLLMGDGATACVVRLHTGFALEPADASLIEAAPEMLRTLRQLERGLDTLEEMCRTVVKDTGTANLAREKADWCRNAIAKATGGV